LFLRKKTAVVETIKCRRRKSSALSQWGGPHGAPHYLKSFHHHRFSSRLGVARNLNYCLKTRVRYTTIDHRSITCN
jgi:hypothetical protein